MNRRWWMVLILPLWASAAATGCQQAQSGPVKTTPIAVYDLPVTRTVTDYEEFPGDIDSPYSVQVTARVSGYMNDPVYFKDGTMVEKEAKLFEIDPRMYKADLDRAEGTVAQYEAHVERLKKEYTRAKNLLASRSVSQEEHDRYKADYDEAVANLEVAKANRDLAALNLEWTEVRAPISGLLSRRMVDPGNLVKADDDRADLDRQPGPAVCLLRRPRAGHAADQAADAAGQAQAPGAGREGGARPDRPCRTRRTSRTRGSSTSPTTGWTSTPAPCGSGPGSTTPPTPTATASSCRACSCGSGCRSATPTPR